MDIGLLVIALIGLWLTIIGGRILFSDKALDKMYEKGYWKIDKFMGEKQGRKFDRYVTGGRLFAGGIIILISTIIALWFRLNQ